MIDSIRCSTETNNNTYKRSFSELEENGLAAKLEREDAIVSFKSTHLEEVCLPTFGKKIYLR